MFDLEDEAGIMRSILWPEEFSQFGQLVEADSILVVRGTIDKRPGSEDANLIVNELVPLEELASRFTRGVRVRIHEDKHSEKTLEQVYEILRGYPGTCELQFVIHLSDGSRVLCPSEGMRVALTGEMKQRVDELLGPGHVSPIAMAHRANAPAPKRYGQRAVSRA
jgi:DNA polymerase-3 subunit alpha